MSISQRPSPSLDPKCQHVSSAQGRAGFTAAKPQYLESYAPIEIAFYKTKASTILARREAVGLIAHAFRTLAHSAAAHSHLALSNYSSPTCTLISLSGLKIKKNTSFSLNSPKSTIDQQTLFSVWAFALNICAWLWVCGGWDVWD